MLVNGVSLELLNYKYREKRLIMDYFIIKIRDK